MTKKNTKVSITPAPETGPTATALLAQVRAAATLDDAIAVLQPDVRKRASLDTRYELVETHAEPLPQKRGASVRVFAVAARLKGPFKVADVQEQLPELKSTAFWVRKLATLGFFKAV